jgi:hypothetical protein
MSLLMGLGGDAVVCGACNLIRAEVPERFNQRCRCQPPEIWEPIGGYDFPIAAELCRCCGGELVGSGSKYSIWFCDRCLELVRGFNAQLGTAVIPVGRHSFHSGLALSASDTQNRNVAAFVLRVGSWFERLHRVDAWNGSAARFNRAILGLGADDVLLLSYLETLKGSGSAELVPEEAFGRMVGALCGEASPS